MQTVALSRPGDDGAFRARIRTYAGQRAAPHAAVLDARLRADRSEDGGVLHEYSTIDGVQEDVVDILLNLKGMVLKMHSREEARSTARIGEGVVTAGDIESTHDVEIVNPDHIIAHLAPGGKVDMQIRVEQGRGYLAATAAMPTRTAAASAASCSMHRSAPSNA